MAYRSAELQAVAQAPPPVPSGAGRAEWATVAATGETRMTADWRRRGYNIAAMRALARAELPRPVFDFADGGAEDEGTLRRNEAALPE